VEDFRIGNVLVLSSITNSYVGTRTYFCWGQ
jgi:hypothetical protein